MNLRMIGLAAVVVFTALLPLAAAAGPADGIWPGVVPAPGAAPEEDAKPRTEAGAGAGAAARAEADADRAADSGAGDADAVGAEPAKGLLSGLGGAGARCGPELASPDGVEAQTCVLTEGRDTWARTYYRNATGEELRSVLTLMGPGGRTLQTHCAVATGDEPEACETPREPSRGAAGEYSAVAEFAAADEAGEGPLLLRSGSNSGAPAGR